MSSEGDAESKRASKAAGEVKTGGMSHELALVGIIWSVLNIGVVMLLRPLAGQQQERLIVSFPGAWIIVGLPLTPRPLGCFRLHQ